MSDGWREFDLTDEEQGVIKILHPVPKDDDPWGVLAPLKGTGWGEQIVVVSGEVMSHALHGWATPLVREIGVAPRVHARRVPAVCSLEKSCIGFKKGMCQPGDKMPDCYEAPDLSPADALLATRLALAWREGRYVVVVVGKGFSLS